MITTKMTTFVMMTMIMIVVISMMLELLDRMMMIFHHDLHIDPWRPGSVIRTAQ